jgi:ATF/CREB family transcription factor
MSSSVSGGATITPNTLNAITGVLASSAAAANANSSGPHPLSVSHLPPSSYEQRPQNYPNGTSTQGSDSRYPNTSNNAANTAANGLFLLSQAHQELTKREEAQRANRSDGDDDAPPSNPSSKRGAKRKSYDVSASPPPHLPKPAPPKRARGMSNGKPKRGDSISVEEDEEEEEDDESAGSPPEQSMTQMNGKKGGQRKPETEEEKRRNFLERNRQGMCTEALLHSSSLLTYFDSAALKCRQRKKAWLAQLQAKNEYLTQENQRLQEALVNTREELARLTAGAPLLPVGVTANAPPNAHPVSVNVSLPATASAKAVVGARGYGY